MRYRPPSRSPGAKRPWLADRAAEERDAAAPAGVGKRPGVGIATVWVRDAPLSNARPHEEQKRLVAETSLPQEEHVTMNPV